MTSIKIFDQKQIPYGKLSNNALTPFKLDGKFWNSVSNYVYSNLLFGTKKTILSHTYPNKIYSLFQKLYSQNKTDTIIKILEIGTTSVAEKSIQFRDTLLKTGNKKLYYQSNDLILGKNEDWDGENLLGIVYERVRQKLRSERSTEILSQKKFEKDKFIVDVIVLQIILRNKLLHEFNDLNDFMSLSFVDLLDTFNTDINQYTVPPSILLKQYETKSFSAIALIENIVKDPDNIVYYVRDYYKDEFKANLSVRKRQMLLDYFMKEILRTRYGHQLNSIEAIEEELKLQKNVMLGSQGLKKVYELNNRIIALFDNGIVEIPESIAKKLEHTIDQNTKKSSMDEEPISSTISLQEDERRAPATLETATEQSSDVQKLPIIPSKETELLNKFSKTLEEQVPGVLKTSETIDYVIFTDEAGEYQILSPYHTGAFTTGAFYYPQLMGFYYTQLIYSIGNIVQNKSKYENMWKLPGHAPAPPPPRISLAQAHRFIMIQSCQDSRHVCDQYNLENYLTQYTDFDKIIQELEDRNKVMLLEKALEAKFEQNHNLQVLLTSNTTGSKTYVYNDPNDAIIGTGKQNGKNYTGVILDRLRKSYLSKHEEEKRINDDIVLISGLFNEDPELLQWAYSRVEDIVNTLVLLYITADLSEKYSNINDKFVSMVLKYFYSSCSVKFEDTMELDLPNSFSSRVNNLFKSKFMAYTGVTDRNLDSTHIGKAVNAGIIDESGCVILWKYISFLTYTLLKECIKQKEKNITLFLRSTINKLTQNDNQCNIKTKLNSVNTCLVSAILNIVQSMMFIYNKTFTSNMINTVLSIIIGEYQHISMSEDHSNIFADILDEYSYLKKYIQNLPKVVLGLNLIYDYVERQISDSFDVINSTSHKIKNRINFFSTIPLSFATIKQSSGSSSDTSDTDTEERLQLLKVMMELPSDLADRSKPVESTMLKPAGRGLTRTRRPTITHTSIQPFAEKSQRIFGKEYAGLRAQYPGEYSLMDPDDPDDPDYPDQQDEDLIVDHEEQFGAGDIDQDEWPEDDGQYGD